jgi:hypothetical protein
MTKVETFVGFLTRPLPLGLASGLPVYVAVPASSILRIPKAFGTGTDALQFVHSDWFRYSSFVLRHSFHVPSLRIEIRDVSTSLDMTSEKRSVSSVNGADGIRDVEGKAARVAASSRGKLASFKSVVRPKM